MAGYFLSYSRGDAVTALQFADDLIAAGVDLWVDQYNIRPSEHWDRAVEAAVRQARGMVVILSPRSVGSANVADEISVAVDEKKHVIPVMIEACTPPLRLTRVQWIDATRDRDAALTRCVAAIRAGALAAPPLVPASVAGPLPAAEALAPEMLAQAEQRLTPLVGPIAGALVRRAAARAATPAEFYADLAGRLPSKADSERFLASVWDAGTRPAGPDAPPEQQPPRASEAAAIPPEALATLTQALIHHLGPIAATLVSREKAKATSTEDLRQRLSLRIAGPRDRGAFLKETARL
jgi:hypothetical protein